jgi:hypothetical protein
MPDQDGNLFLYEALELRGEFDSRIKTLKESLPETHFGGAQLYNFRRGGDDVRLAPAPDVDITAIRERIKALEYKRRKLNAAIQEVNFRHTVSLENETLTVAETLELRKATRDSIAELHRQATSAAVVRVIHKEDRDITEDPSYRFSETGGQARSIR